MPTSFPWIVYLLPACFYVSQISCANFMLLITRNHHIFTYNWASLESNTICHHNQDLGWPFCSEHTILIHHSQSTCRWHSNRNVFFSFACRYPCICVCALLHTRTPLHTYAPSAYMHIDGRIKDDTEFYPTMSSSNDFLNHILPTSFVVAIFVFKRFLSALVSYSPAVVITT